MSVSISAVVVKLLISQAASKKGRKIVFYVIGGILVCLVLLLSIFFPSKENANKVYGGAIAELTSTNNIGGEISIEAIHTIFILHNDKIPSSPKELTGFISQYFVAEITDDDGEEHLQFYSKTEVLDRIKKYPFSFDDEKYRIAYFAFSLSENNGTDNPGWDTGGITPPPIHATLKMPCPGNITSAWGYRQSPINPGERELHTGMDISGVWHQPIYAAMEGEVISANTKKSGYGNYVQIKHSSNGITFYSFYAHMSKLEVRVGQTVTRGQQIGLEGGDPKQDINPGDTTGHHLHFELRLAPNRDSTFDPYPYITMKE